METWFDSKHKEYFYTREPALRDVTFGSFAKLRAFQNNRKCHSFDWYMTKIAKDVYAIYPPPPPNRVWGHIRLRGGHLCWDTKGATSFVGLVQLDICSEQNLNQVKKKNI